MALTNPQHLMYVNLMSLLSCKTHIMNENSLTFVIQLKKSLLCVCHSLLDCSLVLQLVVYMCMSIKITSFFPLLVLAKKTENMCFCISVLSVWDGIKVSTNSRTLVTSGLWEPLALSHPQEESFGVSAKMPARLHAVNLVSKSWPLLNP